MWTLCHNQLTPEEHARLADALMHIEHAAEDLRRLRGTR
jgi:hypothetical protein